MRKIQTMAEYTQLIQDTLYDLDELVAATEDNDEYMAGAKELVDPLRLELEKLLMKIHKKDYRFENVDLPFMALIKNTDSTVLPIKNRFNLINDTHKRGVDA